jgi:hypothetical protein
MLMDAWNQDKLKTAKKKKQGLNRFQSNSLQYFLTTYTGKLPTCLKNTLVEN